MVCGGDQLRLYRARVAWRVAAGDDPSPCDGGVWQERVLGPGNG